MTKPEQKDANQPSRPAKRLDDWILSVNPDLWLMGALVAVVAPWLDRLV